MLSLHACYEEGVTHFADSLVEELCSLSHSINKRYGLDGEILLVLTDDEHMRSLNAHFRNKDRTTDVLSFDLHVDGPESIATETPSREIYISVAQAERQAEELGVPLREELARLLVHGMLHLAGFDHDTREKLEFMERETDDILQALHA